MPVKGKIMSQAFYEKQSKLLKLNQESFKRNEINYKEAVTALKLHGFSDTVAAIRVNEWKAQLGDSITETEKEKKRRLKEQASLEMYLLRIRIGNKKYMELRSKYKNKELSRENTVFELIHFGYSRKYSECTIDKWEKEKW